MAGYQTDSQIVLTFKDYSESPGTDYRIVLKGTSKTEKQYVLEKANTDAMGAVAWVPVGLWQFNTGDNWRKDPPEKDNLVIHHVCQALLSLAEAERKRTAAKPAVREHGPHTSELV